MTKVDNITLTINDNIYDEKKGIWIECDDFSLHVRGMDADKVSLADLSDMILNEKWSGNEDSVVHTLRVKQ